MDFPQDLMVNFTEGSKLTTDRDRDSVTRVYVSVCDGSGVDEEKCVYLYCDPSKNQRLM